MAKFYCQREIEMNPICKTQCEHCKEYYAPLEKDKKEIPKTKKEGLPNQIDSPSVFHKSL